MKNCKKKIKTIEQPLLGMLYHFFLFSFLIIFHFPFYHEMNEFFIIIVQLLYMLWNGIEKNQIHIGYCESHKRKQISFVLKF
jgi:hypothetical protein